ncbi:1,2-phenylacetyl-CoA epoxidase subunit PaaC [Tumebacillus flagellatus]|uniref:Phenylacetate-CoA oxygenase n=1 Tax=Tumebacillus flagellatus TaxID=1157490 RepID=A0A074LP06_9BACL|nr:1,2-phenylacetyl-CoA epoxidase subunit PaaC [Tumebacillus flagellatus]KEO83901.1 phenylacetate-CoA oxygenase [Tumebacillus flagellatus]
MNTDQKALQELLFQLADDDFILAYRGSEWLGLAPHIEEDVAFSSMSQDTMGHAVMFYEMLEELGAGTADDLAQLRKPQDFRNAVLVERPNGTGHYMEQPNYDWAYAVARTYLYELFKWVRLEALMSSSYQPLVQISRKMMTELRYHLMHWQTWTKHLAGGGQESRDRLQAAIAQVCQDIEGLFSFGPHADAIVAAGLIADASTLKARWLEKASDALAKNGLALPDAFPAPSHDGRAGEHTEQLADVLNTLSEVYRLDPAAAW